MDGVEKILGLDPVRVATAKVNESADKDRRAEYRKRVDFYSDRIQPYLQELVNTVFVKPQVRNRLEPFIPAAAGVNVFKRLVDEIAGPPYSAPPRRRVEGDEAGVYAALLTACDFDAKMDTTAHFAEAANKAFHYYQANDRLGLVMHVLTPDRVSSIPDPEDPLRELAIIFDCSDKGWFRYWDRAVSFEFDTAGAERSGTRKETKGLWPFVAVRRRGGTLNLDDFQSGSDRVGLQLSASLLILLSLKLHKSQGFRQPVVSGDITAVPKGQSLDEESILVVPAGATFQTADLKSDASHYMDTLRALVDMTASNYGISRERLNQQTRSANADTGLIERRRDIIRVCRKAEHDAFATIKKVSQGFEDPSKRVPLNAELKQVDFVELSDGADMMQLLDIWEKQRAMALRTPLQNIMALNPEITTENEAAEVLLRNMDINELWIERLRGMNSADDASLNGTGQTPRENGAMGPAVRDEKMTREEAREKSRGTDVREIENA